MLLLVLCFLHERGAGADDFGAVEDGEAGLLSGLQGVLKFR